MKIVIVIEHSPREMFLVHLATAALAEKVRGLIGKKRHSQAAATALAEGIFEREVYHRELKALRADAILSEKSVHWDLMPFAVPCTAGTPIAPASSRPSGSRG